MKLALAALPLVFAPQLARADAAPETARVAAQLSAGIKARDAAAITKVLAEDVVVIGMYFADATCAKKFGKDTTVKKADHPAFAKCLAQTKLQATTREAMLPGSAVLTIDPGFELEVRVEDGLIRAFAFTSATDNHDATPTLTAQAFEALRTAGSTNVDAAVQPKLDVVVKRTGKPVAVWVKTCLDTRGAMTSWLMGPSEPYASVFLDAIANWKFKPYALRGAPMAVCSLSQLSYPTTASTGAEVLPPTGFAVLKGVKPKVVKVKDLVQPVRIEKQTDPCAGGVDEGVEGGIGDAPPPPPPPPPAPPQNVPPTLLEGQRTKGNKLIVPDDVTKVEIARSGKSSIVASFKLCVSITGTVSAVTTLKSSGFSAYDKKIQGEMRGWEYRPYQVNGKPVPVCTAVTFIYKQDLPPPPPPKP